MSRSPRTRRTAPALHSRRSADFDRAAFEALEQRRLLSTVYDLAAEIHDPDAVTDAMSPAAMASSGNLVLVGSYFTDAQGDSDQDGAPDGPVLDDAGLARLYDAATGALIRTFYNPDPQAGDTFGRAVAIVGNRIAITSAEADGQGKVFIYDDAADATPQAIVGPYLPVDQAPLFGDALEAYGDDLLIATMSRGTIGSAGQVLLYDLDNLGAGPTWTFAQDIGGDRLGHAMDADAASGRILVASDGTDSSLAGGSTVLEIDVATSTVVRTYESPVSDSDATFGGQFTTALALAGNTVLIGSAQAEQVYQLDRSTGDLVRTYVASFANPEFPITGLGQSIVVSGNLAIFGAHIEPGAFDINGVPAYAGAAYVFDHTTGDLDAHLTNPTSPTALPEIERMDEFGYAVGALSDGRWAVIDPSDSSNTALNGGGVYVLAPEAAPPSGPSIEILGNGDLLVSGTADTEAVAIAKDGSTGGLIVTIGTLTAAVSPTGLIIVRAGGGDDTVQVDGSVSASVLIDGGEGNDSLKGGGAGDILIGGGGADLLVGGSGRDLLIGSSGADRIVGNNEDDILIAGATTHDDDNGALSKILAEWASNRSYADRVNNLRDGSGSAAGVNDGVYLNEATVFSDGEVDVLTGSSGADWFLFSQDVDLDYVSDIKSWEFSDDVSLIESL